MPLLSERLKKTRLDKAITQKAVADYLGIAEVSYQRFEYGTSKPRLDSIIGIAKLFDVSIDYLVGLTDNPAINR